NCYVPSTLVCCCSTTVGEVSFEVAFTFLELFTPQSRTIISTMMPIAIGIRPGGNGLNRMNIITRSSCSAFQDVIVSTEPSGLFFCFTIGSGALPLARLEASCDVRPPPAIKITINTAKIISRLTWNLPRTAPNLADCTIPHNPTQYRYKSQK